MATTGTAWSSVVNTNTIVNTNATAGTNPNVWYGTQPPPFAPNLTPPAVPSSPWPNAGGITVQTSTRPTEGMLAVINGKTYRYSASLNEWHEVVDAAESEVKSAPHLPIQLDVSGMLTALRQYHDFLVELDGLDQEYANVVDDTLFGLKEAIEALETIE